MRKEYVFPLWVPTKCAEVRSLCITNSGRIAIPGCSSSARCGLPKGNMVGEPRGRSLVSGGGYLLFRIATPAYVPSLWAGLAELDLLGKTPGVLMGMC